MTEKQERKKLADRALSDFDQGLRHYAGYNIKRAFESIRADVSATLRAHDLRMITYSALVVIQANPGLRQSHLAKAVAVERANLVEVVDELEQRQWVTRSPAPTDRRAYALNITTAGAKTCKQATGSIEALEEHLLSGVSARDRKTFFKVLSSVETAGSKHRSLQVGTEPQSGRDRVS